MFASENRSAATDAIATLRNPYHGTPIPNDATPRDIVSELGLNWSAVKQPMYLADGRRVATHDALVREDNSDVLSVVGSRYNPMQNIDVMTNFRGLLDSQNLTMSYAGVLHEGRTYWAAARVQEQIMLPGGDAVHPYVLLFHSHKPGNALRIVYSMLRFVCMNALYLIMRDTHWVANHNDDAPPDNLSYSVYHSAELRRDHFEAIGHEISSVTRRTQDMQHHLSVLARTRISNPESFFIQTVGNPDEDRENQPRAVQAVLDLYRGQGVGSQLEAAKGTYWGALNAVTEYIDHHAGRNDATRYSSSMLGRGRLVKLKAFKLATEKALEAA